MIIKVEARTPQGNVLVLPLEDYSGGYLIKDIQGLDPVKATIVSSSFAQIDGVQYHSSKREARNLILEMGFEPDYINHFDVASLRRKLYAFFMSKARVDLRLFDIGGDEFDISGRVESHEAPLFTEDPGVNISILCPNPDFYNRVAEVDLGMTTAGSTQNLVAYSGTVDTGVLFTINVDRTLNEFTIYHQPPGDELRVLEFAPPLVAGDVVKINSVVGNKGATLNRGGIVSSILYGVLPQSAWLTLQPGENKVRVYAEGAAVPYSIEYTAKYGGL